MSFFCLLDISQWVKLDILEKLDHIFGNGVRKFEHAIQMMLSCPTRELVISGSLFIFMIWCASWLNYPEDGLSVAVFFFRLMSLYWSYFFVLIYFQTTVSESTLFDHLINTWEFSPGPVPGTCSLHFLVDFKFQSPLYRQVKFLFPYVHLSFLWLCQIY